MNEGPGQPPAIIRNGAMIITCPWCGPRGLQEFTYRGDGTVKRPDIDDDNIDLASAYVFDRENLAGLHSEIWHHGGGCRSHVLVMRNTMTHEILSCDPVGPFAKRKAGK